MKPLSIIIPTLNEQDYLPTLLESIIDQNYTGIYEVIVIDGNSSDKTTDIILGYEKRMPMLSSYVYDKGTSRQRNYGVTKAKYDNIVFLDADMQLTKHALKNIAKQTTAKENFVAIPLIYTYSGRIMDFFFVAASYFYFICVQGTHPIVTGMCIVTTKQVHNRISGFNEQLAYGEDIDYGLRAYRSGSRYYVFFSIAVRTSARRLDQLGRIHVARTWLGWYKSIVKHSTIIDENNSHYDFGKFKKN